MKTIYNLTILILLITSSNETLYSQYSLWTWGSNNYGQLGNDRPEDEPLPVIVNDDGDWEKVYSYYAFKKDGSLWTWGNSYVNRINEGEDISLRLFDDSKWKEVYTFEQGIVYGIKEDGSLWSWGQWNEGWNITENSEPTTDNYFLKVPFLVDNTHKWKYFSPSRYVNFAIDETGKLFTWGQYTWNMGIGENELNTVIDSITQVGLDSNWKKVDCLFFSKSIGLKTDGSLWLWGRDNDNLINDKSEIYYEPTKIGEYNCKDFIQNILGVVLLDSSGSLFSIGRYFNTESNLKYNLNFKDFKFGKSLSYAFSLFSGRNIFLWGMNNGLNFTSNIPAGVIAFPEYLLGKNGSILEGVLDLAQVGNGFALIDSSNNLQAWGENTNGELANGKSSFYSEPINIMPNKYFKDVSSGENYSIAIDEYGMMWAWGSNSMNGLGIEDMDGSNEPTLVGYDVDWEKIYTFRNSNFAFKTDNTLWVWGDNDKGQLGIGHNNPVLIPTKVEKYGPWIQIHSSRSHTLALKQDRTLWAWGSGPLGLDTNITYIPMQVNDDTDWKDIGCGDDFSVAVKEDMTYWGWGNNDYGTFGHYRIQSYSKPTKLDIWLFDEIIEIVAGEKSVLALSSANRAYTFAYQVCDGADGGIDNYGNIGRNRRSINSNYDGWNTVVTHEGKLFGSRSDYLSNKFNLIRNSLTLMSEENDWVKATTGRDHILALRGEYITSVKEPRKLENAEIYPNPSLSKINIDFDSFYSNITVSVYDVYGKLVLEDGSSNTDRITINHNLPHGTYILQCRDSNSLIVDQVLVVK